MIPTREVTMAIPAHRPGEPVRIKLTHRPTGIGAEGEAETFDEAKAKAEAALEAAVQSVGAVQR